MLKKSLAIITLLASMALAGTAFAARPAQNYIDIARTYVPATALMQGYDVDKDEVEIKFFDNETLTAYEVELVAGTAQIKEVDIKSASTAKSPTVVKTEQDIKLLVYETYSNVKNLEIKLEQDDIYYEYKVKFDTPEYSVKADMNPVTGAFTEREHKYPVVRAK